MSAYCREASTGLAAAIGNSMIGEEAIPKKELAATRDRIGGLIVHAMEVAGRLEAVADGVFGPVPQADMQGNACMARSGNLGAINDGLDALGSQICRAHDAMTRLEGL